MVAGFLVGPDLLLTNRHVLPTKEVAAASMVEFGYEKDERGVAKPLTQVIVSSSSDLHCYLLHYGGDRTFNLYYHSITAALQVH